MRENKQTNKKNSTNMNRGVNAVKQHTIRSSPELRKSRAKAAMRKNRQETKRKEQQQQQQRTELICIPIAEWDEKEGRKGTHTQIKGTYHRKEKKNVLVISQVELTLMLVKQKQEKKKRRNSKAH